ncbi:MAG: hypothetical protein QXS93_00560 [Candidatus Micrarchaeia archaeon]
MANNVAVKKKDELEKEKKWMDEQLTKNTREWILKNLTNEEIKLLVKSISLQDDKQIKSNEKLRWLYSCLTNEQNMNKEGRLFLAKEDIQNYRLIESGKAKIAERTELVFTPPTEMKKTDKKEKGKTKREISFQPELVIGKPIRSDEEVLAQVEDLKKIKEDLEKNDKKTAEKRLEMAAEKAVEEIEKASGLKGKTNATGVLKLGDKVIVFKVSFNSDLKKEDVYKTLTDPKSKNWEDAIYTSVNVYEYNKKDKSYKLDTSYRNDELEIKTREIANAIEDYGGIEKCVKENKIKIIYKKDEKSK